MRAPMRHRPGRRQVLETEWGRMLEDIQELENCTTGELAEWLGVSTVTISNWRRGMEPRMSNFLAIQKIYWRAVEKHFPDYVRQKAARDAQ